MAARQSSIRCGFGSLRICWLWRRPHKGIEPFQSYEFRSAVALASMLHDIGNLTLPRAVLQKRGKLMPQEYALIKSHTVAGRDLLRSSLLRGIPSKPPALFLQVATDIAMSHHEKWDGSGYPKGLAGEEIPWRRESWPSQTCMTCSGRSAASEGVEPRRRRRVHRKSGGQALRPEVRRAVFAVEQSIQRDI